MKYLTSICFSSPFTLISVHFMKTTEAAWHVAKIDFLEPEARLISPYTAASCGHPTDGVSKEEKRQLLPLVVHEDLFLGDEIKFNPPTHPFEKQVIKDIMAYFSDPVPILPLSLPLMPPKTSFQKQFRSLLKSIPCGETMTYKEAAVQLHSSPRAIGQACRANPFPLIIPCHRIVGSTNIGGFGGEIAGAKIHLKQKLLQYELNFVQHQPNRNYNSC